MDAKVAVPLAMGAGYFLGRTHKFRWAVMLGTAAATGRLGGLPAQAMQRGTQVMQSTPELAKMAESAQRLLEAGRGGVESMGQALEGRVQDLGEGAVAGGKGVVEKARPSRRSTEEPDKDDEEAYDEQDLDDQEEYDDELDESEDQDEDEEQDEAEPEEEAEQPVSKGRRPSGAQGRGSAVRRTRG